MAWQKNNKVQNHSNTDNRIKLITAIVFLFSAACVIKLFSLQVLKFDMYSDMASSQHKISSKLAPKRGEILINDLKENKLYPYATNKDFAHIYVVPVEIEKPNEIAEIFFIHFDKTDVEKEVEKFLDDELNERLKKELDFANSFPEDVREQKIQEAKNGQEIYKASSEYQELRKIKREAEIASRKAKIIEKYLAKLNKQNDPYEPIKNKLDDDELLSLYSDILKLDGIDASVSKMKIKEGKVFMEENGEFAPVKLKGVGHTMVNYRYYPEKNIGSHVLGFVRVEDDKQIGHYGLEGFFNEEFSGQFGMIKSERSADNKSIIVNDREYTKPVDGKNLILTIDRSIQYTACTMLQESVLKHGADSGSVIIIEPETGAVMALCSYPDYDPNNYENEKDIFVFNNPAIFQQYEPGSVMKTITLAAAMNEGKITPESTYKDNGYAMIDGWSKPIKNSDYESHGGWGVVDMTRVLDNSLNTGAIFAMTTIGPDIFVRYLKNFGFNEKTGIELETESAGYINNLLVDKIKPVDAAVASFGQGMTVTPLQMVMSYVAIANGGYLIKPYIVKEIVDQNGEKQITVPKKINRVITEKTALTMSGMLVNVVENGHSKGAQIKGYYIGGKTGTAQVASKDSRGYGSQTIHTFIGIAPIEEPRFVMLTKLDNPKGVMYAESTAVPLFGRIAEYLLNYLEVPKDRRDK